MKNRLLIEGVPIDEVYFCHHIPENNCDCRKPKIGLIEKAINQF